MNRKVMLIALVSFLSAGISSAQVAFQAEQPFLKNIEIGFGLDHGLFRDYATSPQYYRAGLTTSELSIFRTKGDHRKESEFGIRYISGRYSAEYAANIPSTALLYAVNVQWTRLYQIKSISNEKWNAKAGGTFSGLGLFRINQVFENNAFGKELFLNFMLSGKISRDVSRARAKSGSILFVNYSLEPRVRKLSYQLNVGLLNMNYRNGFIYSSQSGLVNDFALFDGYELKTNGFRLSADLDYTLYFRKNNNVVAIGYTFDGVKTKGNFDDMQFSSHVFRLSLLFNTK